MSRFVGVVIDLIVGKKSAEESIDSFQGKLSGLRGVMSQLRAAAALVGGALAAAFGIVGIVEAFRARLENNKRSLDELTSSAKLFAQEVTSAFRNTGADAYAKQIADVSRRSLAAIEEVRSKAEASLTSPRNALFRQFGFGPSRTEILAEVESTTRAVEQATALAQRRIREQEEKDRKEKQRKERDDLYKTVGAEIRSNREAQLDGVDKIAFKEQEELRKTSALRIRLAELGERELADAYERAIRDKYKREKSEYDKNQAEKRRQDEEDSQRLAKTVTDALMKANEAWRKDFEEQSRAVTQELASQFQNTLAGFAGILEQQAGAARRGPWREI